MMVSINQSIDFETAKSVATEFGFEVQDVAFKEEAFLGAESEVSGNQELRPPVITVMGHVDHGKTSLLDAIRRTNVVAGEAGGITQHVGAYQVQRDGHTLTFIDTPGHEAFTAMRARGAQVTDIVVLVVAASEGIMPQTIEAIDHARAAEVPIVVAINKCDLPGANPQQVRQRLMSHNLVPEEFGGDVLCVEVSALKGTNLDKLLETLVLQAEVLELRADPKRRAAGVVLEAHLDRGRGPVATVLVQQGTLRPGDSVVAGTVLGRVRALENENGERVKEAGPATPVQVFGLSGVPDAGEAISAVESERVAKQIVDHRLGELRAKQSAPARARSLEDLFGAADGGGAKQLRVVLKADVQGTVEAVRDALTKLSTDEVEVQVMHSGVGAVTESDVMLARASDAIVVGFHVRPDPAARRAADGHGVDVRIYQIIYELTDEVRKAMAGLLPPKISEQFQGRAEVRKTFAVPRIGTIAGCYVAEGSIRRGGQCRLLRDGVQVYEGKIGSLKRFKDDTREVQTGFECGIGIEGYNDLKVGDMIETFSIEEKPATL
jgi:translation initiation factor IF-2